MRAYYNFTEVSLAKETLSLKDKTDRFGNPMVSDDHIQWAKKVLMWFNNYLCSVRNICKNVGVKWNNAVSILWKRIKSGLSKIKDDVIRTIYEPLKSKSYIRVPLK